MDVQLHRRAEIALRSLTAEQHARATAALRRLREREPDELRRSRLAAPARSRSPELYVASLDGQLRAILEFTGPFSVMVSAIGPAERVRVEGEDAPDEGPRHADL